MKWYDAFNAVEAGLWGVVALVVFWRSPCRTRQQRYGIWLGSAAFVAFGITDLLELGREGTLPIWLWGLKISCGAALLVARFTWLGWHRFSWQSREMRFGLACLIAVISIIALQRWLNKIPPG